MCGIVGFINCGTPEALAESVQVITHRGPDDHGMQWFMNANSGLGHRRLSIIDLSQNGHQPMPNDDQSLWIVFNGEIFNYREIKQELANLGHHFNSASDTEVILKGYQQWGRGILQKLDGMFAFAIYEPLSGKLFVARDRFGIKPLYYYRNNNHLIFASEIKSILASGVYHKQYDMEALYTPVHYQTGPLTGFKNILKLLPARFMEFENGNLSISEYWSIRNIEDCTLSEDEATLKLDKLLTDSVNHQMIADVPIGLLLSGGLDSSIIGAKMKFAGNGQINSFTIRFKKDDLRAQGYVDDSLYAKQVADHFGFNHQEIVIEPDIMQLLPKMIWHMDEPVSDAAAINTYLICKEARERGIYVLLTGMGADEIFSGYRTHLACLKAQSIQNIIPGPAVWLARHLFDWIPASTGRRDLKYVRWIKGFLPLVELPDFERFYTAKASLNKDVYHEYFEKPAIAFEDTLSFRRQQEIFNSFPDASYVSRICLAESSIYMSDHNLLYSDKSSMAASVELRPPFLNHHLVEFIFSLPSSYKIKGNTQKYLLKKAAKISLEEDIINRPKAPFSAPLRGWIKNELSDMVDDILSESSVKKRGIYNFKYISRLIKRNKAGIEDHSQTILNLLINELWFRTFFSFSIIYQYFLELTELEITVLSI